MQNMRFSLNVTWFGYTDLQTLITAHKTYLYVRMVAAHETEWHQIHANTSILLSKC